MYFIDLKVLLSYNLFLSDRFYIKTAPERNALLHEIGSAGRDGWPAERIARLEGRGV